MKHLDEIKDLSREELEASFCVALGSLSNHTNGEDPHVTAQRIIDAVKSRIVEPKKIKGSEDLREKLIKMAMHLAIFQKISEADQYSADRICMEMYDGKIRWQVKEELTKLAFDYMEMKGGEEHPDAASK